MDLEALKLRTSHNVSSASARLQQGIEPAPRHSSCPPFSRQEAEPSSKPDDILEAKVDAAEWKLEVERVLPQLKVTIRTDNKVELT